jgi:hypothetical protein
MTYVGEEDGGKVFTISLTSMDVNSIEFKFVAGPDWAYEQVSSDNWKYGNIEGAETDKVSFALSATDFKYIFDPEKAGDITITATVPAGTERVWIQGSFFGWEWDDPEALEMIKQEDGTFTYTVEGREMFEYRLYNGPDWPNAEVGEADPTADLPNRKATFVDNGENVDITVWGWQIPTANALVSAQNFRVYPVAGQIHVEGDFSQVAIYSISGHQLQSTKASGAVTSKVLPAGIYVVVVDGIAKKVLVR